MKPTRKTHKIDLTLHFHTGGDPLELRATGITLTRWGEELIECRLQLETDLATLRRMEREEYCHLTKDSREQAAIEGFQDEKPVLIEARLEPSLLELLPEGAEAAAASIEGARNGSSGLLEQGSWYVLNVKQSRGAVSTGYRTTWFEPAGEQVVTEGMPLLAQVVAYLREKDWYFTQDADDPQVLKLKNQGDNESWTCFVTTQEERSQFAFYSVADFSVPEERIPAVAEYICRANFGLMIGNFELDFDDGQVRFKTSVDVEGAALEPLLEALFNSNLYLFDLYAPGLRAVAFEGASPADAQP